MTGGFKDTGEVIRIVASRGNRATLLGVQHLESGTGHILALLQSPYMAFKAADPSVAPHSWDPRGSKSALIGLEHLLLKPRSSELLGDGEREPQRRLQDQEGL